MFSTMMIAEMALYSYIFRGLRQDAKPKRKCDVGVTKPAIKVSTSQKNLRVPDLL